MSELNFHNDRMEARKRRDAFSARHGFGGKEETSGDMSSERPTHTPSSDAYDPDMRLFDADQLDPERLMSFNRSLQELQQTFIAYGDLPPVSRLGTERETDFDKAVQDELWGIVVDGNNPFSPEATRDEVLSRVREIAERTRKPIDDPELDGVATMLEHVFLYIQGRSDESERRLDEREGIVDD